jgi:hypothetical protein
MSEVILTQAVNANGEELPLHHIHAGMYFVAPNVATVDPGSGVRVVETTYHEDEKGASIVLKLDDARARAEQHLHTAQAHMRGDWMHNGDEARLIERELHAVIDLIIEHGSCYFCASGERTDTGEYVHSLDCPAYLACMGQPPSSVG